MPGNRLAVALVVLASCCGPEPARRIESPPLTVAEPSTPVPAPARVQPTRIVDVFAGGNSTCVLWNDKTVVCSGSVMGTDQRGPVVVDGLGDVVEIAMARDKACALDRDGTVRCWGRFRDPYRYRDDAPPRPELVQGVEGATGIHVENLFACALVAGGALRCWGPGARDSINRASITGWTRIATMFIAICGSKAAGGVECRWMHNGELPDEKDERIPETLKSAELVLSKGELTCWSGEGRIWCDDDPRAAVEVPEGFQLQAVYSGGWCGITARGTVRCYGSPIEERRKRLDLQWRDVQGPAGVTKVAAGFRHACALAGDGRVWCWGQELHGQFGEPLNEAEKPLRADVDQVRAVTGGESATSVVTVDGDVLRAGKLPEGEYGGWFDEQEEIRREEPVLADPGGATFVAGQGSKTRRVPGDSKIRLPRGAKQVVQFVDGIVPCYLLDDRTVACVEEVEELSAYHELVYRPKRVPLLTGVSELAGSYHGICALMDSGDVLCRGPTPDLYPPGTPKLASPTPVRFFENVDQIAVAGTTMCASVEGRILCKRVEVTGDPPLEAALPWLDGGSSLVGAFETMCATAQSTRVRCVTSLDRVFAGQQGTEQEVELPAAVTRFAFGKSHVCALVDNGELYCWGDNRRRQLGLRRVQQEPLDVTDRFTPPT